MLSVVRARAVPVLARPVAATGARAFATDKGSWFSSIFKVKTDDKIVAEADIVTGVRKEELGGLQYSRDSIDPPAGSGTKDKPIEVPSRLEERAVGFEDPESHAIYWFNLRAGKLHYVTALDKYFKLVTY